MFACGLMIAHQVAGKATRDALFLSSFDITALPTMLIVSAVVSIAVIMLATRAMSAIGPGRLIPYAFAASGLLFFAEWVLYVYSHRVAAVAVFLHLAVFGLVLISGFWSLVSEFFDPRTARRKIARIGAAGTLGGLLGGLLAAGGAGQVGFGTMLPLLGVMHLGCAALTPRLRSRAALEPPPEPAAPGSPARPSGIQIVKEVDYLRNLAVLILLVTVAAAFVDYVFKARASERFPGGGELMRFFALFYTGVSVVTFAVQTTAGRFSLERLGLSRTVATLPIGVAAGSVSAIALPGLVTAGIARATEAVLRSSLFRSGYELFYTPILPAEKRATKPILDVGVDRLGDAAGGALIRAAIVVAPAIVLQALMPAALALSVVAFIFALRLHRGYVSALEKNLLEKKVAIEPDGVTDSTTRTTVLHVLDSIAALPSGLRPVLSEPRSAVPASRSAAPRPRSVAKDPRSVPAEPPPTPVGRPAFADPLAQQIADLRSGDPARVRNALSRHSPLDPALAAHVIPLLAWDEVQREAVQALAAIAPKTPGQLIDHLLDPDEEFAVRRRIPRVLRECRTQRVADGLLEGLRDRRFEVRFQCGQALRRIREGNPDVKISESQIFETVLRDAAVDRRVWETQRLLDQVDDAGSPFVDRYLQQRSSRSLEHVFTILSLVLPTEPLQIAYRGLHTDDAHLRGTALEYLETVLPSPIRESLWPFLEVERMSRSTPRSREEILADLVRSHRSIQINLAELWRREDGGASGGSGAP